MAIEIVDFPSYKMVIFHCYVSSPEGIRNHRTVNSDNSPENTSLFSDGETSILLASSLKFVRKTFIFGGWRIFLGYTHFALRKPPFLMLSHALNHDFCWVKSKILLGKSLHSCGVWPPFTLGKPPMIFLLRW